eukprot:GHVP01063110.1.p1 GENE.GHVP01063110.1~~GHVP01063110.1.p1  ORF type:complete len:111 (+),score=32.01 GHVP01063110.1:669-1001(+)
MTSVPGKQNIQMLLDSEKKASVLIAEARQKRSEKIKNARTEAATEVTSIKKKLTDAQRSFENVFAESQYQDELEEKKRTEVKIKLVRSDGIQNKEKGIAFIWKQITKLDM